MIDDERREDQDEDREAHAHWPCHVQQSVGELVYGQRLGHPVEREPHGPDARVGFDLLADVCVCCHVHEKDRVAALLAQPSLFADFVLLRDVGLVQKAHLVHTEKGEEDPDAYCADGREHVVHVLST